MAEFTKTCGRSCNMLWSYGSISIISYNIILRLIWLLKLFPVIILSIFELYTEGEARYPVCRTGLHHVFRKECKLREESVFDLLGACTPRYPGVCSFKCSYVSVCINLCMRVPRLEPSIKLCLQCVEPGLLTDAWPGSASSIRNTSRVFSSACQAGLTYHFSDIVLLCCWCGIRKIFDIPDLWEVWVR